LPHRLIPILAPSTLAVPILKKRHGAKSRNVRFFRGFTQLEVKDFFLLNTENMMKNNFSRIFAILILLLSALAPEAFAQQGGLDTTFGTNNTGIFQDPLPALNDPVNVARAYGTSEVLADGKIIVAGNATKASADNSFYNDFIVRRLNADGSLDTSFGTGGDVQTTFFRYGAALNQQSSSGITAMKIQPSDGKIIVAGICYVNGAADPNTQLSLGSDLCMIRYNQNGTLDTSFGGNTVMRRLGNTVTTYTMDPGKVWTYTGTNFINNDTVNTNGIPVRIQIAPDGRIYVFGNSRDDIVGGTSNGGGRAKGFVAVYSTAGALQSLTSLIDTTGNDTAGWGEVQIYDGDLLSNGDFVAAGYQRTLVSSNPTVFSASRWKVFSGGSSGGFLETDVNAGGSARAITMIRSNKILVGGQTGGFSQFGTATLVRYNSDLTVDITFGTNGRIVYNDPVNFGYFISRLKTQPDGKILATDQGGSIGRLNPDGSFDRSFARYREDVADGLDRRGLLPGGRYSSPFPAPPGSDTRIAYGGISFRTNGKIVTGGSNFAGNRAIVTQLKTSFRNGGTFADFNNDGKAEIAVFRPSDGVWHSLDSFDNSYTPFQWGLGTDKLAPADYDGDGRTDKAVFRNGTWYIYQSSHNQVRTVQWGSSGDLPVPGDYNGDGQADIAVYRPSNGTWYISYSNPVQPGNVATAAFTFGISTDIPVLGDFDGDGKTDITVFRNGVWYQLMSNSNYSLRVTQFGSSGDVAVVGDYDGDGKADVAVFRSGTWYVLRSSDNGFTAINWGQSGDRPVPGDYDNDGRNDFAIFRGGIWWILRSSDNGYTGTQFGLSTDKPIGAAYLP
jgi:uncharacterized delta-60 repeat protein